MFDPKDPLEEITLTFDFSAVGDTASNPEVIVRTIKGVDTNPSGMLSGSPEVSGPYVLQKVIGGITGCDYQIYCLADIGDDRPLIKATLPVRSNCS